ncbi:hypothetical protein [Companilactobacillus sp.]|jgi:hypothetical protein|uniref:hypothetical protein n=1 Tax=Companilactobacillus sp. TaxID=2767905 RepID=UPI0025B95E39|nr:hypothetical protein [Companilactobacillus sp.]MCH4008911.1 hypothetical protein [Companilactobacillus sp.]MCH4050910.1 hypothetical protein [Companilactobacillus sp.]MCH4076854.1 hypothetical protein [Companilactobacillus sp.]MCH4125429.1 hypothetical protein [Companilactobacillus sp.]MCH4131971.1 hypothetical protein [Companilactobacillus sp.]
MLKKKSKYILIALLALLMFFGLSSASDKNSQSGNTAKADDVTVIPKETPSPDPLSGFLITWRSGYSLQPQSQYTYIDSPVTMSTKMQLSPFDFTLLYKHLWYQSTDGRTWTQVKGANGNSLTVTPSKTGVVYYQKDYRVNTLIPFVYNHYWSQVASITTLPDPIDATDATVSVDNDYLYNNQSSAMTTFAHAKLTPSNSTAKVSWSVDNTTLATIDATTGEITANTKGQSGTVNAIATITNSTGKSFQRQTAVKIGGGLEDQTVNEGETATFAIQGKWGQSPTKVVWHKVLNGKDTVVETSTSMSYTTPETLYTDDQAKYYADITMPSVDASGNTTTANIKTGSATLTVNADTNPKVNITSNVYNQTYDDHNSDDTIINGVMGGDKLVMKGTITDTNANSVMTAAGFRIRIPINMAPSSVKVDGEEYGGYVVDSVQGDDTVADIAITNLDFSKTKTHTYEIAIDAGYNNNLQFVTTPTLYGQTADESNLPDPYTGNPLGINFSDGELNVKAHDIDYGQLKYSNVGTAVDGSVDGTNNNDKNLLTVNDNRRDKTATQIFLAQTTPFSDGSNTLASELRYYNGSNYTTLTKDGIPISSAANGSALNSVGNNATDGLKLYMYNSAIKYGSYSSTLSWTVVNAPE